MDTGEHADLAEPRRKRLTEGGHDVSPGRVASQPPSVAMLRHLQRTAGNQAVNQLLRQHAESARTSTPVQRTPIQRDPAPAPAAPGNPVLHALFQESIAKPIRTSSALLRQPRPDAKGAQAQQINALHSCNALIGPLRAQGNEVAAEGASALGNSIHVTIEEIRPHTGARKTLPEIADENDRTEPRLARVDSEIGAAPPAATPAAAGADAGAATANAAPSGSQ